MRINDFGWNYTTLRDLILYDIKLFEEKNILSSQMCV